jgi:hypothetical protein
MIAVRGAMHELRQWLHHRVDVLEYCRCCLLPSLQLILRMSQANTSPPHNVRVAHVWLITRKCTTLRTLAPTRSTHKNLPFHSTE